MGRRTPIFTGPPPAVDADLLRRWMTFVFDRKDGKFDLDAGDPVAELNNARKTVAYLTALFLSGGEIARRFRPPQIARGVWYLFGIESEHCAALHAAAVPREERVDGIRAIANLYRECFDPLCRSLEKAGASEDALCGAVYMIWDMNVIEATALHPVDQESVDAVFWVLEGALRLRSRACMRSGLHALGHLHLNHPQRVERIIDAFLARPRLPDDIVEYAREARRGAVM